MNIIFVCHGSICRSPAAEFIFKKYSKEHNVISRALTHEEIGNDIYPPMKRELNRRGIPFSFHPAIYLAEKEYLEADYIFYMDKENYYHIARRFDVNDKVMPIYRFAPSIDEIEDPWYTGNYSKVVSQIEECIKDILKNI
ncbi:MAG: low molecular weight phosphotyrosine protein phosphatase [Bacilli bacterium]|nr:low molecular weight phosphotyrosine protein phosphatase [Bacilli bacterium]